VVPTGEWTSSEPGISCGGAEDHDVPSQYS